MERGDDPSSDGATDPSRASSHPSPTARDTHPSVVTPIRPERRGTSRTGALGPRARRKRRRWARRALLTLVGIAVVVALAFGLRPAPVDVERAVLERGRLVVTVEGSGKTRHRRRFVVSSPIAGQLARLELERGDVVVRGGVLARIAPPAPALLDRRTRREAEARLGTASAALDRARALVSAAESSLELASRTASRARALRAEGSLPEAEVEQAEAAERLARFELLAATETVHASEHEQGSARALLERAVRIEPSRGPFEVTSPIDGRVLGVLHGSEGFVGPGSPLVELGDPASLELVVELLSEDAVRVQPGSIAHVEGWGGPSLRAHVRLVEPLATTKISALGVEEQRVDVVLDFDEPRERLEGLGDGYRARVVIEHEALTDRVLVPLGAVFRRGSEAWAFTIDDEDRARERRLDVLAEGNTHLALDRSLSAGTSVVLHPSDRVRDGARLRVREDAR